MPRCHISACFLSEVSCTKLSLSCFFFSLVHCLSHRRDSGNKLLLSHRRNCRTVCLIWCRKWKMHCEKCRVQKKKGLAVQTAEWHQIGDYSCFCQSFSCYQVICIYLFRNGQSVFLIFLVPSLKHLFLPCRRSQCSWTAAEIYYSYT